MCRELLNVIQNPIALSSNDRHSVDRISGQSKDIVKETEILDKSQSNTLAASRSSSKGQEKNMFPNDAKTRIHHDSTSRNLLDTPVSLSKPQRALSNKTAISLNSHSQIAAKPHHANNNDRDTSSPTRIQRHNNKREEIGVELKVDNPVREFDLCNNPSSRPDSPSLTHRDSYCSRHVATADSVKPFKLSSGYESSSDSSFSSGSEGYDNMVEPYKSIDVDVEPLVEDEEDYELMGASEAEAVKAYIEQIFNVKEPVARGNQNLLTTDFIKAPQIKYASHSIDHKDLDASSLLPAMNRNQKSKHSTSLEIDLLNAAEGTKPMNVISKALQQSSRPMRYGKHTKGAQNITERNDHGRHEIRNRDIGSASETPSVGSLSRKSSQKETSLDDTIERHVAVRRRSRIAEMDVTGAIDSSIDRAVSVGPGVSRTERFPRVSALSKSESIGSKPQREYQKNPPDTRGQVGLGHLVAFGDYGIATSKQINILPDSRAEQKTFSKSFPATKKKSDSLNDPAKLKSSLKTSRSDIHNVRFQLEDTGPTVEEQRSPVKQNVAISSSKSPSDSIEALLDRINTGSSSCNTNNREKIDEPTHNGTENLVQEPSKEFIEDTSEAKKNKNLSPSKKRLNVLLLHPELLPYMRSGAKHEGVLEKRHHR